MITVSLCSVAAVGRLSAQVGPELRGRSLAAVRNVLERERMWVKVHAAEYLLWLD
jgi:hypothetical protein